MIQMRVERSNELAWLKVAPLTLMRVRGDQSDAEGSPRGTLTGMSELMRHNRETVATQFKWYAGSALVGVAALLAVGIVLRFAGLSVADYAVMGVVLMSPFLVALLLR